MGNIFILKTNEIVGTPIGEIESIGDDPVSQAMLKVLERVVGARTRPVV